MSNKPEKKQRGSANVFRVLGGGYLVYLAYQLFKGANESSKPYIGLIAAVVFTIAGAWVLWIEWKAYKYGVDHVDDPESWSLDDDAAEDEELQQLMDAVSVSEECEVPEEDAEEDSEAEKEEQ